MKHTRIIAKLPLLVPDPISEHKRTELGINDEYRRHPEKRSMQEVTNVLNLCSETQRRRFIKHQ